MIKPAGVLCVVCCAGALCAYPSACMENTGCCVYVCEKQGVLCDGMWVHRDGNTTTAAITSTATQCLVIPVHSMQCFLAQTRHMPAHTKLAPHVNTNLYTVYKPIQHEHAHT